MGKLRPQEVTRSQASILVSVALSVLPNLSAKPRWLSCLACGGWLVTTLPGPTVVRPTPLRPDLTEAGGQLVCHQLPNENYSSWRQRLLVLSPCGNGRPTLIRGIIKLGTNSENEILSDLAEPVNKELRP